MALEAKDDRDEKKEERYLKEVHNEDEDEVDLDEALDYAYREFEKLKKRNSRWGVRIQIQEDSEAKEKLTQSLEELGKLIIDLL